MLAISGLLAAPGCSPDDETLDARSLAPYSTIHEPSRSESADQSLYPTDRIVDVDLTLSASDWDTLRAEGRSTNEVYSGCLDPAFEYTTVRARARIDGVDAGTVGLRKKGFLGSLSMLKPSLRVDFNAFASKQTFLGRKDLTLNNSRSDTSLIHQCLAYQLFADAGIPAPRCAFARVTKNGEPLGVYVSVEPMKKPFLKRHFRDADGDLYEGSLGADFRRPNLARFEKKTNERDPDISALLRVTEALESDDEHLVERLAPLVDLDQFFHFWAMETLTGHFNGYTGSLNNFMMYRDPALGKLVFLPWGTDGTFTKYNTFLPSGERPVATYAWARLPGRLYAYEPTRRRYQEVLRTLLDTVWREPALDAEISRMATLLGADARASSVASLRRFVATRRVDIERELAAPDVPWTIGDRPFTACTPEKNTTVSGTFATVWGAARAPNEATTLTLSLDGKLQTFASVSVAAGGRVRSNGSIEPPTLSFVGRLADGGNAMVSFDLDAAPPRSPGIVPLHGFETSGSVTTWKGESNTAFVGYIGKGKIVFEQAGMEAGAAIVGRFEATFLQTRASGLDVPLPEQVTP